MLNSVQIPVRHITVIAIRSSWTLKSNNTSESLHKQMSQKADCFGLAYANIFYECGILNPVGIKLSSEIVSAAHVESSSWQETVRPKVLSK